MTLWGANAEESRLERWVGGEDGPTAVETNYYCFTFLAGPSGCVGNVFAEMESECPLAAKTGRFRFERNGKGRVVVNGGLPTIPQASILIMVEEVDFDSFHEHCLLSRDEG